MYKSIFETKPNKENKRMFCNRICDLLNDIYLNFDKLKDINING